MNPQLIALLVVLVALAAIANLIYTLIRDWKKEDTKKREDSKPFPVDKYENEERVPPWTLGDAVKFGFGFGMGMFLWGVFLVLVIIFFLTGGMNTIYNFFSPSNTPVSGTPGQYNVNGL